MGQNGFAMMDVGYEATTGLEFLDWVCMFRGSGELSAFPLSSPCSLLQTVAVALRAADINENSQLIMMSRLHRLPYGDLVLVEPARLSQLKELKMDF